MSNWKQYWNVFRRVFNLSLLILINYLYYFTDIIDLPEEKRLFVLIFLMTFNEVLK